MPYQSSRTLSGERASKLGHLAVLKSSLVQRICASFEDPGPIPVSAAVKWLPIPASAPPLPLVFAVDGSYQIIEQERPPRRTVAFIKTAVLRLDRAALAQVNPREPHPFAVRDILSDAALYHATALPLRHVFVSGYSIYDLVREAIFESIKDASLEGEPMETLKWLAYEKWDGTRKDLSPFDCPHCRQEVVILAFDTETSQCPACGMKVFLTDWLGFHQDMAVDAAPDLVATSYLMVHETLLLFTAVRLYWESQRDILRRALFIKDGPLALTAQFSKLVAPIRRFLAFSARAGYPVALIGQEKTGRFFDHLQIIGPSAPEMSLFIPDDIYIKTEIQHRPLGGAPYGEYTNYGAKAFVHLRRNDLLVLSIATAGFVPNPTIADLLAADAILSTLLTIGSARFTGALLPIELANDVASLSTYPSARILKVFAETAGATKAPST
jgi:hypothetical protein